jgi:hypothetical protein
MLHPRDEMTFQRAATAAYQANCVLRRGRHFRLASPAASLH